MKARMQELLGLLTLVVERVREANARAERAERRAAEMSVLLDALSDDNAALRHDLDRAEDAAATTQATIRVLHERVEAGERLAEVLEARATEAELRIHRAGDALGLSRPLDEAPAVTVETPRSSIALH